jgi:hypothetical protein
MRGELGRTDETLSRGERDLGVWLAAAVILFAGTATLFVLVLAAGGLPEAVLAIGGIRGSWVPYVGLTILAEVGIPAVGWGFLAQRAIASPTGVRTFEDDLRQVDLAFLDGRLTREEYLALLREFGRPD